LLRRVFSLRKTLLTYLSSMVIAFIINLFALIFALETTFWFLLVLVIIIVMSYQYYFENIYVYLSKSTKLLNIICILSATLYIIPFLVGEFTFGILLLFVIPIPIGGFINLSYQNKQRVLTTTEQLTHATIDEFVRILQQLASKQIQNPIIHQYIIQDYNIKHISPTLSKRLDFYRRLGDIKDYEYIISKSQIKINIIL